MGYFPVRHIRPEYFFLFTVCTILEKGYTDYCLVKCFNKESKEQADFFFLLGFHLQKVFNKWILFLLFFNVRENLLILDTIGSPLAYILYIDIYRHGNGHKQG